MYRILEANHDFVLIDKAPGVSVHKDQSDCGLVMQLQRDLELPGLSPVHRLDRVTSGLMLLACHAEAAAALAAEFRLRRVSKYYLALSDRKPRKKQGTVSGDMAKARRGAWKLTAGRENPAVSQFFCKPAEPGQRLFLLRPLTGKTHQLRVALKSIGAPIIGDPLYHEAVNPPADRTYLHAYALAFTLNGRDYRFCCPPEQGTLFQAASVRQLLQGEFAEPELLPWPAVAERR
ncbi:TIGR01621 family pseudouridine synthase [Marinobacterium arenosum]|uniref:TIGR01621 family pseudouridine synthase n=1 Tax=Marinobacterium arenosum TaxID=2862496 RepID=UPI001C9490C0|nr:TIGR01621 family pseudouridine synthase [Marinobacterium arenosum]MBY4677911.1 TIGR01621 family pseudouridine synthase [Marinobacterium arenosum]